MWTHYTFLKSGYDAVYLMQWFSQNPLTLPQIVTEYGTHNVIKSDSAPEFKGKTWMNYLRKHQIQSVYTEAHHLNENTCEHRGGVLKATIINCLVATKVELEFWCYCLEHMTLLQSVIARHHLGWQTLHELHFGDTPDISMF